ncbi:hypothetical protein RUND412_001667 [Rhizina undulata]
MSPPNSQPSSLSARQARIAAMESRLDELLNSRWRDQSSRQAQLFSKEDERKSLTTTLVSVTEKIVVLDRQHNGANAPRYYRLKAMKGDLKQKINALSEKIAAEKKAYEEDSKNSEMEKKVIENLQKLIETELAWEEN